jgi:GTPase
MNTIAIVGRPNVGKSTLFNRLVGSRQAIMDNQSGVTRDRHYGYGEWTGYSFSVIDTGGYVVGSEDVFEAQIRQQVKLALEEADVILFVVDVDTGLTGLDEEFADVLRRSKKPIFVIGNKADDNKRAQSTGEFYALGLGDGFIYPISAQNGAGTGDLLDEVIKHFPTTGQENPDLGIPRIAVMGRPNVGKSSLVNLLLGQERAIVTDQAGTTRDAINTRYTAFGHDFILTDTAGLRRKAKVSEDIEFYSNLRSIRAMEDSDVVLVMLDATRGIEAQDVNIITLADRNKKGIVILVNKWDLVEKDTHSTRTFEEQIYEKIAPMTYPPIIFTSVITKQRVLKAIETAVHVYERKTTKISTSKLNDVMLEEIGNTPPPIVKGKVVKIKYVTQVNARNPTFVFFCSLPQYVQAPYMRFLENRLREHFDFSGVPITLAFRQK